MLPLDDLGTGDAVLLIHAGVVDRRMWRGHLGFLADEGYRAIAVDLPGFGDAPLEDRPQAPWEDVLQTMQELGIDRTAIVGNSFGAAVALRVAAVAPSAVWALALISPVALNADPSPQLAAAWAAENEALDRDDLDAACAAVVDAWTLPDAPADLRESVAVMQRRALELQSALPDVTEAPDPLEQHPEALRTLDVPTLCAAGEHDMPDFLDAARWLAAVMPRARETVIPRAGHLAPLEEPAAFASLLLAFLRDAV